MSITTVIITKNEEKHIETCIRSVDIFSSEIIIVDSFSTDKTREIATSNPKVKFVEREFDDYISQKNYGNELAKSDYIFSIDADEYCSQELIDFLKSTDYQKYDIVSFLRINKINNHEIVNGIWKNDFKERLWIKGKATWAGTIPHEHLEYNIKSKIFYSNIILYHNAYSNLVQYYNKSMHYSELASKRLVSKSYLILIISLILNPIFKFVKGYFFKSGYLDGFLGLQIAKISFLETQVKYSKAIVTKWKKS